MPDLFLTLMIAFIAIIIAIACLAIGWLITGKTKIQRGACGRDPTLKKEECDTNFSCDLCGSTKEAHPKPEEKEEKDKHYS